MTVKTAWVKKELNPQWDEAFKFETAADVLIVIWDHDDLSRDDYMGECSLELSRLTEGVPFDGWLPLRSTQKGFPKAQGEVHVRDGPHPPSLFSFSTHGHLSAAKRKLVHVSRSESV